MLNLNHVILNKKKKIKKNKMETVITEVPCNQTNQIHTYCEGMVTEDSKKKKTTNDIISD